MFSSHRRQRSLFTCLDVEATKVFKKESDDIKTILEELENEPLLQAVIIGGLQLTCRCITPNDNAFGVTDFGDGLTLLEIMRDQHRIGWINFSVG